MIKEIWIEYKDKWLHAIIGAVLGLVSSLLAWAWDVDPLFALVIPVLAGLGKELWDQYIEFEDFSWADWFCTIGGGLFGVWIFVWLIPV
jgi:hypothetical protein